MKQLKIIERYIYFDPEFTTNCNKRHAILRGIEDLVKLVDGGDFKITVSAIDYNFSKCKYKITLNYMEDVDD